MTTVRGITSRVDIVWSSDGEHFKTIENVLASLASGNTAEYAVYYTIPLLNTTDDGRVYQCEVVINTNPPISTSKNITLDVIGKHILYPSSKMHLHNTLLVPVPDISIIPFGSIQGALVGSPEEIHCLVSTVSGVEPHLVMISWMGPGGETIKNDDRVTIIPKILINKNYISTLEFTYLMEGDEGIYTC